MSKLYTVVEVKDNEYIKLCDIENYEDFIIKIKQQIPNTSEFINVISDMSVLEFKQSDFEYGYYLIMNVNKIYFMHKVKIVIPGYLYNSYGSDIIMKNKWILIKNPQEKSQETTSEEQPPDNPVEQIASNINYNSLVISKSPNQVRYLYPPNNMHDNIFILTDRMEKLDLYSKLYPQTKTYIRYGYISYNINILSKLTNSFVLFDIINFNSFSNNDELIEIICNMTKKSNTFVLNIDIPAHYIDKVLRSKFDKIIG